MILQILFTIVNGKLGAVNLKYWNCFMLFLQVIVKRINLCGKLNGHRGCVNTVEFNSSGDLLVSGSDDRQVMFWDWATKTRRLSYPSGHSDNIFQTKVMPFSDDRKIVTSSGDGQVNFYQFLCKFLWYSFLYLCEYYIRLQ